MAEGNMNSTAEKEARLATAITEVARFVKSRGIVRVPNEAPEYKSVLEANEKKIRDMARYSTDGVYHVWDKQWKDNLRLNPHFFSAGLQPSPYMMGNSLFRISNCVGVLSRVVALSACIRVLEPRSVVEVGCGDGLNLMILAGLHPQIAFTGIELTAEGVNTAQRFQTENEVLPNYMLESFPETKDPKAFKAVRFETGSAFDLKHHDASFDMVTTCVALEQMESNRRKAIAELARIASRWVAMIEPFRDFNAGWPSAEYIEKSNYFQGSVADLPDDGIEPFFQFDGMPQKLNLRTGLVVGSTKAASS